MAAPKYWNESMTPAAKPALRRPPISMGAAAPTIECVEFAVKEINTRKRQLKNSPLVPRISIEKTAIRMTTVSRKYSVMATGERWPRKTLSDKIPDPKEPRTATRG